MKIITVAHQKGGVGKSTLTLNLAACFAQTLRVAMLDTDQQGSLTQVRDYLGSVELIPMVPIDELARLHELPYDVLLIDTPPYLTDQLPRLLSVSDFVLVPSKVGFFDVLAVRSTIALIQEAVTARSQLKYGLVLNLVKPGSTRLLREVKDLIRENEMTMLNTAITNRDSYVRSALTGGVFTLDDAKAQEEILQLAEEMLDSMGV